MRGYWPFSPGCWHIWSLNVETSEEVQGEGGVGFVVTAWRGHGSLRGSMLHGECGMKLERIVKWVLKMSGGGGGSCRMPSPAVAGVGLWSEQAGMLTTGLIMRLGHAKTRGVDAEVEKWSEVVVALGFVGCSFAGSTASVVQRRGRVCASASWRMRISCSLPVDVPLEAAILQGRYSGASCLTPSHNSLVCFAVREGASYIAEDLDNLIGYSQIDCWRRAAVQCWDVE